MGSSPATAGTGIGMDGRVRSGTGTSGSEGGVGIGIGTPGLSALGLGIGVGGLMSREGSMGMSAMGIGGGGVTGATVGNVRDNEEERRRRIEGITEVLGKKWGRVSREGVEGCARRLGLECLWEDARGKKTLSIAGNGLLIDIEFIGERVNGVVLSFPGSGEGILGEVAGDGARVLKEDLSGKRAGGGDRYVVLDAFAANVERMARLDRLGVAGVSCFEAVEGVHGCLRRIFEWDMGSMKDQREIKLQKNRKEVEVLRRRNGRPRVHAEGQVGLRLEYWMDKALLWQNDRVPEEMDLDDGAEKEEAHLNIWSISIECESSPAELYPPIRISSAWVTDTVEKPTGMDITRLPLTESTIDWQEPPLTYTMASDNGGDAMNLDQAHLLPSKAPDVRFVAKLEPPILVTLQSAMDIFAIVDSPVPQVALPATYENILASRLSPPSRALGTSKGPLSFEKVVCSYGSTGEPSETRHLYTFFSSKLEEARLIHEVPFSHPRQLTAMLPILRQWALLGSILREVCGGDDADDAGKAKQLPSKPDGDMGNGFHDAEPDSTDELDAFLSNSNTTAATNNTDTKPKTMPSLPVDISLAFTPNPRLTLIFPNFGKLASLTFTIHPNGIIEASDFVLRSSKTRGGDGGSDNEGEGEVREGQMFQIQEKAQKVLAIAEDLGVVVEWMSVIQTKLEANGDQR